MALPGLNWIDVLLFAVVIAMGVGALKKVGAPNARVAATILATVALLHFLVDGFRWQIVPLYAAILLTILTLLISRRWARFVSFGLVLIMIVTSALASWAFPVFELPEPLGDYAVGTTTQFLTDVSRHEAYTEDESDRRQLTLKVWYPSDDPESGIEIPYWRQPTLRSRAILGGSPIPWFAFTHLGKVETHSRADATVAEGRFPVLIYSHGLGIGWSSGNTALVEELASQGYVVITIGHSYIGSATIFPDHVAYFDPATRVAMDTEPPDEVMEIYGGLKDIRDPQEQLDVFMRSMSMMPVSIKGKVDVALDTQIADQKFVIESLSSLQSEQVDLRPHVDLDKVGLFGMSIGGSAAVLTCSEDMRCGAAVNLDGFHPAQAHVELPVPLLALHRSDNLLVHENYERAQTDAYLVEIAGSTHFNYFDFTIISPLLKKMGILGPIDGEEMVGISRDFLTAFFDKHLKQKTSPLLEGRKEHASKNVTLQRR